MKALRALWMDDLRKLMHRSAGDWLLLAEAGVWLGLMRAAILFIPFQKIAGWLGLSLGKESQAPMLEKNQTAEQVGWAIRAVAPRTMWESACLAQALTCAVMLKSRHIPGLLYLGVAVGLTAQDRFSAHAWLRCGDSILVGAEGHERFQVIATFSLQANQ